MFNFGAMDYAGTVREEANQACARLRFRQPRCISGLPQKAGKTH